MYALAALEWNSLSDNTFDILLLIFCGSSDNILVGWFELRFKFLDWLPAWLV